MLKQMFGGEGETDVNQAEEFAVFCCTFKVNNRIITNGGSSQFLPGNLYFWFPFGILQMELLPLKNKKQIFASFIHFFHGTIQTNKALGRSKSWWNKRLSLVEKRWCSFGGHRHGNEPWLGGWLLCRTA